MDSTQNKSPDALTVTLTPIVGDPRPVEVRWRQALKDLKRRHGLRAEWPEPQETSK